MTQLSLEEMNTRVREEIADKTLSFGCYILLHWEEFDDDLVRYLWKKVFKDRDYSYEWCLYEWEAEWISFDTNYTVIGHPPHIWVVMQYIRENWEEVSDGFWKWFWNLLRKRPDLSSPLPTPGTTIWEEWRDVLLFLNELSWESQKNTN